jgi:hypothetical protein
MGAGLMKRFSATVYVVAETEAQASQVLAERLAYDEDYGYDYRLNWTAPEEG